MSNGEIENDLTVNRKLVSLDPVKQQTEFSGVGPTYFQQKSNQPDKVNSNDSQSALNKSVTSGCLPFVGNGMKKRI